MFYQGTWQFVQHSASFCFRPWSKHIKDIQQQDEVLVDIHELMVWFKFLFHGNLWWWWWSGMQDFQKPPEKQEQQTSSDCPSFYDMLPHFEWSNDCWICWWKKFCSTWHYKKPLENLGYTTGTSDWWCRIAGFLFPTFFSIAVNGDVGLIEFSELVARYSEGKSQGLSFCQVLNLPVRNGSDNGWIWTLRTWRNILTTKS